MNNIIRLKEVKRNFDEGRIKALDGIDLKVERGEFLSIIGPSGSGKSTLLNIIGALDKADDGLVRVAGVDLMNTKDLSSFRSQQIGFVFQMHNLIPNLSVTENVEIPLYEANLSGREMRQRTEELLELVDLSNRAQAKPNKLSGGERQRVALARALANHPSIILADEPTGSLDSKTGKMILERIKEIHENERVTLLIVTHEPYVARSADRVVEVLDGKIKPSAK
jgi:putative ABC transport system ATP-binding protein